MSVKNVARLFEARFDNGEGSFRLPSDQPRVQRPQVSRNSRSDSRVALPNKGSSSTNGTHRELGQLIVTIEEYNAPFSPQEPRDLLQAPIVLSRAQSSDGRLPDAKPKVPPPKPKKPSSLSPMKELLRNSDNATVEDDDNNLLILIDNDPGQNGDSFPLELLSPDGESQSRSNSVPEVTKSKSKLPVAAFSKSVFGKVQGLVIETKDKVGGVVIDAKGKVEGAVTDARDKVVLVTKPMVEETSRGFDKVQDGTNAMLEKMGVSTVFSKTQDDILDITAKYSGKEGLCSKCRKLPMELSLLDESIQGPGSELGWATPLSRILFHAEWCLLCRLLLGMLYQPKNDPLQHYAVARHIQPELSGITMRDWVAKGWEYNDRNWPFGHGAQRHEGASYIVGPAAKKIMTTLALSTRREAIAKAIHATNKKRSVDDINRELRHREQLREARKPSQHPLSCVVKITANVASDSPRPGLLFVNLWGYGRKHGAELQILSSFRLRAVPSTPPSVPSNALQQQSTTATHPFSYGRLLDRDWIDPSIGRHWLRECEGRHGTECNQHGWEVAMEKPTFLRAIDVEDFCVREIANPAECRYIALSYVWGGVTMVGLTYGTINDLMRKGGLLQFLDNLPQTIIDAMEVVKAMGERYLWVDTLCLLQEKTKDARYEIDSMHRVYGSALATIVAAQGTTAFDGLRGIRQYHVPPAPQRQSQQRNVFQSTANITTDIAIIAPFAVTNHHVDESIWNSRAWTFQERLLSRRLIIFSHGQIIWHCRKMICQEDMPVADSDVDYTPLQWLSLKPKYFNNNTGRNWVDGSIEKTRHNTTLLVRSATFAEYAKAIEQYTHRELTYKLDILRACAGLLNIFSQCFGRSVLFGLPESHLDFAILWRPSQQLERRKAFPSWSWAGWVGRVAYDKPFKIMSNADGEFVSFRQEASQEIGGEEGIRPLIRWHMWDDSSRRMLPLNGNGLGFPFDGAMLPEDWENGPYNFDDRGNGGPLLTLPRLTLNPALKAFEARDQYLFFWASVSQGFRIGEEIVQQSDWKPNSRTVPRRYRLIDGDAEIVGNVLLDGGDNVSLDRGRYEFIQIAEAQYFNLDGERKDVEGCPLYLVMLIEWDERRIVASRVGLGRVHKTAWMLGGPMLKQICLG